MSAVREEGDSALQPELGDVKDESAVLSSDQDKANGSKSTSSSSSRSGTADSSEVIRKRSTRQAAINGKRLMKMEIENPWGYHRELELAGSKSSTPQSNAPGTIALKKSNKKAKESDEDIAQKDVVDQAVARSPSEFEEPPEAALKPGVTGVPLEFPPPEKLKKEYPKRGIASRSNAYALKNHTSESLPPSTSLATSNESRASRQARSASPATQLGSEDITFGLGDEDPLAQVENGYRAQLITGLSEELTKNSETRASTHRNLRSVPKPGSEDLIKTEKKASSTDIFSTPKKRKEEQDLYNQKMSKRVKSSPMKKDRSFGHSLSVNGQNNSESHTLSPKMDDPTLINEDFCSACGYPGIFLCCEGCPKSFHFLCCDPPVDEENLPSESWFCKECLAKTNKTTKYNVGIFSKLLNQAEMRNPRAFQLPKKIRETFEGVSTGSYGEYQDNNLKAAKTYRQIKSEADSDNIYDKDGKPLFCHQCGGSGLNGKTITSCDYCSLSWHLDCVSPPLTNVKTIGTKWKCPNHLDGYLKTRRKLKKQPVIDVSMSRGFKTEEEDIIEIEHDMEGDKSMDATMDTSTSSDYLVVQLPVPAYLDGWENTTNGISYPFGRELSKLKKTKFKTYRLKESSVILDFLEDTKTRREKEIEAVEKQNTEIIASVDSELKTFINAVSKLSQKRILSERRKAINLKELLDAVEDEVKVEENQLDKKEMKELLMIKRLMQIKGQESLLSFLKSD